MTDFWSNAPAIIEAAARSNLGILALLILATAVLGFVFFRNASHAIRLIIFFAFFLSAVAFAVAVVRVPSALGPPPSAGPSHDLTALVSLAASPLCATFERYSESFTGGANAGACRDGRDSDSRTLVLTRPGYTLDWFDYKVTKNHRGGGTPTRRGDTVVVNYYASHRGVLCNHRTGSYYWRVTLHGIRESEPAQDGLQEIQLVEPLKQGSSAGFKISDAPSSCTLRAWIISGEAALSDGTRLALPPRSVPPDGEGEIDVGRIHVSFNAQSSGGTVHFLPSGSAATSAEYAPPSMN